MKQFLGDPGNLFAYTLANALVVALFSNLLAAQISGILVVAVMFFTLAYRNADVRLREETYRRLPGQIKYHTVEKILAISNDGTVDVTLKYDGDNLGDEPLTSLYHRLTYDAKQGLVGPLDGRIGNDPARLNVTTIEKRPLTPTTIQAGNLENYESRIYFDFPMATRKGESFPAHQFTCKLTGSFQKAFLPEGDSTSFTCDALTQNLLLQVHAPPGFTIIHIEQSVNDFHERPDALELYRVNKSYVPELANQKRTLQWRILYPKLTYAYKMRFRFQEI